MQGDLLKTLPGDDCTKKSNNAISSKWVFPKIVGGKTPKMDGLFHGNPYLLMEDLGVFPYFGLKPKYF